MRASGPGQSALLLLDVVSLLAAERIDYAVVAMKVFAGGPLDLSDARHAIAAAGESLDRALASRLATGFGREARSELERLLADSKVGSRDAPGG